MRDAWALAARLYSSPIAEGWVRRGRKSPRFVVGYTSLTEGRARVVGSSDVDWESAFANAQGEADTTTHPETP